MKLSKFKVRLTDRDKLILSKYTNICTDLHGNGCSINALSKN